MICSLTAPDRLCARIHLPSSKSISSRALIICYLSYNPVLPQNISDCDDIQCLLRALNSNSAAIHLEASGTAMRFLTAYFAISRRDLVLNGSRRLCQRPISALVDALRELGAKIQYIKEEGFLPIRVTGTYLKSGTVTLPADISSQFVSALLMIAPMLDEGLNIRLEGDIVSRPYIDMTLKLMHAYGASAEWTSDNCLQVAHAPYLPTPFCIENDWSAASYWYEMVALSRDKEACVELEGLQEDSLQGDAKVKDYFKMLGVSTTFTQDGVVIRKDEETTAVPFEQNLSQTPDLTPAIVVTCAMQKRAFHITGLHHLQIKECDRLSALTTELQKFGIRLSQTEDALSWDGTTTDDKDSRIIIDTYNDHRMAMAFAPCAFLYDDIAIWNHQVTEKSYPNFWKDMETAGFHFMEKDDSLT